jgi:hypothetical protein
MLPPPDPFPPLVILIHGTLLTAVHVQPPLVLTATVPVPPPAGIDCDGGVSVKEHPPS